MASHMGSEFVSECSILSSSHFILGKQQQMTCVLPWRLVWDLDDVPGSRLPPDPPQPLQPTDGRFLLSVSPSLYDSIVKINKYFFLKIIAEINAIEVSKFVEMLGKIKCPFSEKLHQIGQI